MNSRTLRIMNSREGVRENLDRRRSEEEAKMAMIVDLFRRLQGEG
jgi:hypothetical protein